MHIAIITQHYWPESVGTARRAQLLAEYFVRNHHTVTVLCGWPNHPSMSHWFQNHHDGEEYHQGIRILRIPIHRSSIIHQQSLGNINDTIWFRNRRRRETILPAKVHRILTYSSWMIQGVLFGAFCLNQADVLLSISPLPTGVIGASLARLYKKPHIFDLQDIWPDAAVKAGIFSDGALVRMLEKVEHWVYAHSQLLVVLSPGFKTNLLARTPRPRDIVVIPNAVDTRPYPRHVDRTAIRVKLGYQPDDTIIIYAGNHGLVQDLDILISAAVELRHILGIHFLFVGDGLSRRFLKERAEHLNLHNVRFLGLVSKEKIPGLLAAADICFLSLKKDGYTEGTIPSKLYEYFGAKRPIINLIEGDTACWIDSSSGGINLPAERVDLLTIAILALHSDGRLRQRMGDAGWSYVQSRASIDVVGKQYEHKLNTLVA